MNIIKSAREMQAWSNDIKKQGQTIGFVPTMGFLHPGHLSLMKTAKSRCDHLVVSIFVNPTQFGENEDLDAYPVDLENDLKHVQEQGACAVFLPSRQEIYPPGFQTYVTLSDLPSHLCGLSRPVHFRGVATVVTKLFNIVKPDVAVFGEKDFQQLQVIRQMVRDLNFDIEIVGGPTFREPDGLAMSSRNSYLKNEQRPAALSLVKSLEKAQELVLNGETDPRRLTGELVSFIQSFEGTEIDYVAACDPETLEHIEVIQEPFLLALAVKLGKTRLIDNRLIRPGG